MRRFGGRTVYGWAWRGGPARRAIGRAPPVCVCMSAVLSVSQIFCSRALPPKGRGTVALSIYTQLSCLPPTPNVFRLAPMDSPNSPAADERAALEQELSDARATIAALQAQLAAARASATPRTPARDDPEARRAAAALIARRPRADREVLSDCSEFSAAKRDAEPRAGAARRRSGGATPAGGVRKKKGKERAAKPKVPGQSRYWTPDEHKLFLEALREYGHKDLRSISAYVGTRNMTQVRTHSQKYFMRLMREAKRQNPRAALATDATPSSSAGDPSDDGTASGDGAAAPAAPAAPASTGTAPAAATAAADPHTDKYSVPNTCGMTLLCLVGQDTLTN